MKRIHLTRILLCLTCALALLLSGCQSAKTPDATKAPAVSTDAPAVTTEAPAVKTDSPADETAGHSSQSAFSFSTTDRDGNAWDQTAFADYKLVMVNFFEPWCGPCVEEMPELERLYQEYKDKGVLLIGVYRDEEGVDEVLTQTGVTYPILHYTSEFDVLQSGYVPNTVFFNSNANLVGQTEIGAHSYDEWAEILDGLL